MKLEFSGQIFEKYWNAKFHENSSSGSWVFFADGRTDRQTWRSYLSLFKISRTHL